MKKNALGVVAAVTAALTVVAVLRGVLPDVRRYLRISRM
ncbi:MULTISPECIES: DUF6893 family small protein [unclassified Streptomyces]